MSATPFARLSPLIRQIGRTLESIGAGLEVNAYTEKLVPQTRILAHAGKSPSVTAASFVAPTASVIGDVAIGANSSVWYGATLRGDVHHIRIGEGSSIGDRAVVHVAKFKGDAPTTIGNRVTVGANAIVHACTLEDECMVGAGAQVLDNAVVKKHAVVAPGAVVTGGATVESGQLWAGVPAAHLRDLTPNEISFIAESAAESAELAQAHAEENAKHYTEVLADEVARDDAETRSPDYLQPNPAGGTDFSDGNVLDRGAPGLIYNNELAGARGTGNTVNETRNQFA